MGKDRKTVEKEVSEIKSWLATHPVLPTVDDDLFLERFHSHCKFNIEKTKKKMDIYYKTRIIEPEMLLNRDPQDPILLKVKDVVSTVVLPKLTPEGHRVTILKLFNRDPDLFDPEQALKIALMMQDAYIRDDTCNGYVLIIDGQGFTPQHLFKITPNFLKKADVCSTKAFPHRYVNIHFLNMLPIMQASLNIYKMLLGNKMASRIIVHSNYSSLHENLPKTMLPKEYEGTFEFSFEQIRDATYDKLMDKRDWFLKERTVHADIETCKDSFKDIFGSKGTFRSIEID
ncbi:clavesin-2-like isoform X2 [Lycorma delicatula]